MGFLAEIFEDSVIYVSLLGLTVLSVYAGIKLRQSKNKKAERVEGKAE